MYGVQDILRIPRKLVIAVDYVKLQMLRQHIQQVIFAIVDNV